MCLFICPCSFLLSQVRISSHPVSIGREAKLGIAIVHLPRDATLQLHVEHVVAGVVVWNHPALSRGVPVSGQYVAAADVEDVFEAPILQVRPHRPTHLLTEGASCERKECVCEWWGRGGGGGGERE